MDRQPLGGERRPVVARGFSGLPPVDAVSVPRHAWGRGRNGRFPVGRGLRSVFAETDRLQGASPSSCSNTAEVLPRFLRRGPSYIFMSRSKSINLCPHALEAPTVRLNGKAGSIQKWRTDLKGPFEFDGVNHWIGTPTKPLRTRYVWPLSRPVRFFCPASSESSGSPYCSFRIAISS